MINGDHKTPGRRGNYLNCGISWPLSATHGKVSLSPRWSALGGFINESFQELAAHLPTFLSFSSPPGQSDLPSLPPPSEGPLGTAWTSWPEVAGGRGLGDIESSFYSRPPPRLPILPVIPRGLWAGCATLGPIPTPASPSLPRARSCGHSEIRV